MIEESPRLEVQDIRVSTEDDQREVVRGVSFRLWPGRTLGLVGESGSGKSTVALALLGYARRGLVIRSGSVLLDGDDVLQMEPDRVRAVRGGRIAYVPQDPTTALNPALRVGVQLREVLTKDAAAESQAGDAGDRLAEVLGQVRLSPEVLAAYPHQLSGGQQQRAVIAMAFLLKPQVIVLDEPTTGLDVTTQRHVLNTIRDLCSLHGVAGLFVSHDLAVIGELVDHIAVLYGGEMVELGTKGDVLAAPAHPYTRALLTAVPSPTRSHTLVGLGGHPPAPGKRPAGCLFAPRCPFAEERCVDNIPEMVPATGGGVHLARCLRLGELPSSNGRVDRSSRELRVGEGALLTVEGLSASYGSTQILHDVSLEVRERTCVAVVGESGSGKTTLARCIVGLHRSWSGEVRLDSRALATSARDRASEELRAVQYVFQNPYASLNPRKTVGEIIEQPLIYLSDAPRKARQERVVAALEDAALTKGMLRRSPGELSGGERQRVALARALVVNPKVVVCDEVTSALDVSVQAAIIETLRRLQHERDLALIFITHNLALVRSIAQQVIVMQSGVAVEAGETNAVLDRPQAEYTKQLLVDVPKPYLPDPAPALAE
jgi:peptide/nickel transport system ATP-binding protein